MNKVGINKRIFRNSFLIFFCIIPVLKGLDLSVQDACQCMMRQNLSVYPYEEPEWPSNDVRFKDYLAFIVDMQENLQENSARRAAFLMLRRFFDRHPLGYQTVVSDNVSWKDLSLFSGQTDELHYLSNIVDRSCTVFGNVCSYSMLALPTCDLFEFSHRQEIVKRLVYDEQCYEKIRHELMKLHDVENNMITFWLNDPFANAIKRKYFNISPEWASDYLNKSSAALNVKSIFEHKQQVLVAAAIVIAAIALPIYGLNKIANKDVLPISLNRLADNLYSSGGSIFGLLRTVCNDRYTIGGMAVASGCMSAMYAKESAEWAVDNFILDKLIYKKMNDVAIAIKCLRNIYRTQA